MNRELIVSNKSVLLSNSNGDNRLLSEQNSSPISEGNYNPNTTQTRSSRKFCSNCGTQLTINAKYCSNCGKKVPLDKPVIFKKRTPLIAFISIILTITIILSVYLLYTKANLEDIRDKAFNAMYDQNFKESKFYFDQYPDVEEVFPSEYAYVQAGLLYDGGKYIDALQEFREIDYPIPEPIIDKVTEKVYSFGITSYRSKEYAKAMKYFNLVGTDYKRTKDYLTLIKAANSSYMVSYQDLMSLLGFENVSDIILNQYAFSRRFLEGTWKTKDNSKYFKMDSNYTVTQNITSKRYGNNYSFSNGVYREFYNTGNYTSCFHFEIVDKDTILVSTFVGHYNTYSLYRQ